MKPSMRILALALLVLANMAWSARADYVLSWVGPTTAIVNTPLTINLVISDSGSNVFNFGLASASVKITRNTLGFNSIGTITSFTPSPLGAAEFDMVWAGSGSDPTVSLEQLSFFGAGRGSNTIIIGSFVIESTVEGSGSLSVAGLNNTHDDIAVYIDMSGNILNLSDSSSAPGAINLFATAPTLNYSFTAIPEPSSICLAFIAAGGMAAQRLRRSKSRSR